MQTRGQILHLFLHLPFVVSRDQPLSLSVQLVNFPNDIQTVSLDLDSLQAYLACFLDGYARTVIRVAGSEFLSDFLAFSSSSFNIREDRSFSRYS